MMNLDARGLIVAASLVAVTALWWLPDVEQPLQSFTAPKSLKLHPGIQRIQAKTYPFVPKSAPNDDTQPQDPLQAAQEKTTGSTRSASSFIPPNQAFAWLAGLIATSVVSFIALWHSKLQHKQTAETTEEAAKSTLLGESNHGSIAWSRRQFQAGALAMGSALPAWASTPASILPDPSPVPSAQLGSLSVSRIIQGHWQLAGGHGREPYDDPSANMRNHYNAGIYTFDTADIYGPSQEFIGKYLAADKPSGAVICTKFCCFNNLDRIGKEAVRRGIQRSLNNLGVKQLDLVAFFWSDWRVKNYVQTALYLKELKEEGLIKEIGVTNFDVEHLAELVDAGVPVVSNQVQYSLIDRRPENGMVKYCAEKGIKIIAFGTVCSGYLSSKYLGVQRPPPISTYSESLYSTSIYKAGGWQFLQLLLRTLDGIAQKHGVTIANVAQRWVLQKPEVAAIIVGVRNSKHIEENVQTFSFSLDDEDLAEINAVLEKEVPPAGDIWFRERGLI